MQKAAFLEGLRSGTLIWRKRLTLLSIRLVSIVAFLAVFFAEGWVRYAALSLIVVVGVVRGVRLGLAYARQMGYV